MNPVDFYQLPRPAQERFVGSVNGTGLPAPILRAPSRPMQPMLWLALSGASFLLLVVFLCIGYGSLTSGLGREGLFWALLEVTLAAAVVFGVLRAKAAKADHDASPFRRGLYVFPVGLIDARSPSLRVYPLTDIAGVFGPDVRGLTLAIGSASFAFPVQDPAVAASARTAIDSARASVNEATAARESMRPKALAALDPLQGYANPLASSDRMTRVVPAWATFSWGIALAGGLVIGGPLWLLRNAKSDDSMFARAALANDGPSYRAYLAKGARHAGEVTAVLLPRALLREAQAVGTVEAIEQFIAENPHTSIAGEAAAARRAALLADLDVAVKAGTLAAINDFSHRHPDAQLDAEVQRARHGVYQAALARYVSQAPEKAAGAPFVEHLLAWAEKKGPAVEIRFHRQRSRTLDRADSAVGKNAQFKGVVSLPSRYFDDAAEKADLAALADAVTHRFAAVFPAEILAFSVGQPLADTDVASSLPIASPTLFVERGEVWAGSIQSNHKPLGVFVGLELSFDTLFCLPDGTKPVRVRVDGWHLPNVVAARDAEQPEQAVYKEMREKAFEPFQRKLLAVFFKDGS